MNWDREVRTQDFKPALSRYGRFLEGNGLRKSTISSYVFRVGKFLEFAQSDEPQAEDFDSFQVLQDKKLSGSSIIVKNLIIV